MNSETFKKLSYLLGTAMLLLVLLHSCRNAMKQLLLDYSLNNVMENVVPFIIMGLLFSMVSTGIAHIILEAKNGGIE